MAAGLGGAMDFVGYPVGQGTSSPTGIPTAGLYGLLDFVGIPVGLALGGAARGHGAKVAGKPDAQMVRRLLQIQMSRSLAEEAKRMEGRTIQRRVRDLARELYLIEHRQALLTTNVIYTTLLAEL